MDDSDIGRKTAGLDSVAGPALGSHIGPYEIVGRLGRGGMGEVFLGNDPRLRRHVALKCLLTSQGGQNNLRSSILREARTAARINHPNVATVYDVIEHDGRAFIVMEYVKGETLAARLIRERLPIQSVVMIGRQLAAALMAAHAHGVIHRDLKPANVVVTPGGSVKVLDFGVAQALSVSSTASTETATQGSTLDIGMRHAGTPPYMSPEQLLGRRVDQRSDVYSLGVILYEMVTGHRPHSSTDPVDLEELMARPLRGNDIDPDIQRRLSHIITTMLEVDPRNRFQAATELGSALENLQSGEAHLDPKPKASRTPLWLVILLILLGIEILGFVICTTFNRTLGRMDRFGWDSPGDWFIWGVKSLIGPASNILQIYVAWVLLRVAARKLSAWSSTVRTLGERGRSWAEAIQKRLGLDDPVVVAQAIAMMGAIGLIICLWVFGDLLHAFWNPISDMLPDQLVQLRPENADQHYTYRSTFDALILVLSLSLAYLYKMRARRGVVGELGWPRLGLAILALTIVVDEMSYRVLFHSDQFEIADIHGNRCFIIGENKDEMLVHCPSVPPPRNQIVRKVDPAVHKLGIRGSVYESHP